MTDSERELLNWGRAAISSMQALANLPSFAVEAQHQWMRFVSAFREWEAELKAREANSEEIIP
jgi:hypothetical protein